MALKIFRADDVEIVDGSNNNKADKTGKKLSKNLTYISNIAATKEFTFLSFNAKKSFNYLKQIFIKVLIF